MSPPHKIRSITCSRYVVVVVVVVVVVIVVVVNVLKICRKGRTNTLVDLGSGDGRIVHATQNQINNVLKICRKGRTNTLVDLGSGDGRIVHAAQNQICLLYTSPSPRDLSTSRMPSSA